MPDHALERLQPYCPECSSPLPHKGHAPFVFLLFTICAYCRWRGLARFWRRQ